MSLLAVIAFGLGMAALLGLSGYFFSRATSARRNAAFLDRLGGAMDVAAAAELADQRPARMADSKWLQQLLLNAPVLTDAADLLDQSGLKMTVAMLLGQMTGVFAGAMIIAMLLHIDVAPAFFLGLVLSAAPLLYVVYRRQQRALTFEAQLPHALELISLYLRSGRSLPQAFVGATEELLPPASEEFSLAAEEYRLGRPLDASLRRVAVKYPESLAFRLLTIAVSVLGQTGGNLVEILERIKKQLDASVQYQLRLKAMTGESRMSAWILALLPGIFLLVTAVLNPSYFNVFFDLTMGRVLFGIFLLLWAAGIIWIRQLMQSKLV